MSTVYGIWLNDWPAMIVGAGGGTSSIGEHSALVLDDKLYLAVGNCVACFALPALDALLWSVEVDPACCYGLYREASRNALITWGELAISRLSLEGELLWQAFGADIFTEGFCLHPDHIEAVDFERRRYRFDYETGKTTPG